MEPSGSLSIDLFLVKSSDTECCGHIYFLLSFVNFELLKENLPVVTISWLKWSMFGLG